MIFRKKKIRNINEISHLSYILRDDNLKPVLSESNLKLGRQSILNYIKSGKDKVSEFSAEEVRIATGLKNIAFTVHLSSYNRIRIKERILDYCQNSKRLMFSRLFKLKIGLAALFLIMFSFATLVFAPEDSYLIKASKWTFIEEAQGEAFILRDGKSLQAKEGISLQEGDILVTKGKALVAVRFFDDSIARLGENTAVEIKKLYAQPNEANTTGVEVVLQQGYLWTKVVSLYEESRFVINTDNAVATVRDKAAFEITKNPKETTLEVYDNVVDFKTKSTAVEHSQPIVKGFTAKVSPQLNFHSSDNISDHTFIVAESINDSNNSWIALNQELDKEHEEKLKRENQNFIDKAAENKSEALGFLKDIRKGTKSLLPTSEFEQVKTDLLNAHEAFLKAQKLLSQAGSKNQKRTEALKYLYQYKSTVRQVIASMPDLIAKDENQAVLTKRLIAEFIALQKKNLALVLPNEKLFISKEIIEEVSSYLIEDDLGKVNHLLDQTKTTLLEVAGLIEKRQFSQAESHFQLYVKKLDQLIIEVNGSDFPNLNSKLVDLLNDQFQQIKLLTTIEQGLKQNRNSTMQQIVKKVNIASMKKLLSVTKALHGQNLSFELLQEFYSVMKNYFQDDESVEVFFLDLDKLMQEYPEYKLWKETQMNSSLTSVNSELGHQQAELSSGSVSSNTTKPSPKVETRS